MILKLVLSANEQKRRAREKTASIRQSKNCIPHALFVACPLFRSAANRLAELRKFCRLPFFFLQLASENGFGKIKYCVRPCLTSFHE